MNMFLGALKSKTIWAAIATIILGALVDPVQVWVGVHPGIAATVIGAAFAFLRTLTTGSLASKAPPSA